MTTALDRLLAYAKKHALDVKWRRGRVGPEGFWEVWCDGEPLWSDWTPAALLKHLAQKSARLRP